MFLPEGDPNRTEGVEGFGRDVLPEPLRQRVLGWLQEVAIAQLRNKEKP